MRKSLDQLKAEQIVVTLLKNFTPEEVLYKARQYAVNMKYAVAERITVAIMLMTCWETWDDFDEAMMKELYDRYLMYHESYNAGNEKIFNQLLEINKMLDGDLLKGDFFEAVVANADGSYRLADEGDVQNG